MKLLLHSISVLLILILSCCTYKEPQISSTEEPTSVRDDIQVEELLLSKEDIPIEWTVLFRNNELLENAYQESEANLSLFRTIDDQTEHISQKVLHYESETGVNGGFNYWVNKKFTNVVDLISQIPTPEALRQINLHSEKWKVGCYLYNEKETGCVLIAKYGLYLVYFGGIISSTKNVFMPSDVFVSTLIGIDEKASTLIYETKK
jgi:hypothetical protein